MRLFKIALVCIGLLVSQSSTAMFKCTDTKGQVSFQDVPCLSAESSEPLSKLRDRNAEDNIEFVTSR